MPPLCHKIYPLNQAELSEPKKKKNPIIELLKENKIQVSDSPHGSHIFFA